MIKVYNTKEVADILKVKPLTIRQYILDKKLKAKPLGRTYVITEDELTNEDSESESNVVIVSNRSNSSYYDPEVRKILNCYL